MKYTQLVLAIALLNMTGCGGSTVSVTSTEKSEGPPVNSLSHDQLMVTHRECTQYGQIDDPKVKYTVRYCAAIQSAHLSEGYTNPSTTKVDPTLNKIH